MGQSGLRATKSDWPKRWPCASMLLWCIVPTSVVHTTADSFRLRVFKLYLKVHTVHTETSLGVSARGFFSPVVWIFHPLVFLILGTLLFETRSKYDQISRCHPCIPAPYSFCNSHNRGTTSPFTSTCWPRNQWQQWPIATLCSFEVLPCLEWVYTATVMGMLHIWAMLYDICQQAWRICYSVFTCFTWTKNVWFYAMFK